MHEVWTLLAVGFGAGILGGLLGIGGSVVMIPILTLVFHHDQHVSQAAAMTVNILVASAAFLRHRRAGTVRAKLVGRLLPAALVCIYLGVLASEHFDGFRLQQVYGVFLIYVIIMNIRKLTRRGRSEDAKSRDEDLVMSWPRTLVVGGITGFAAGLLGIGGGIIAVPLMQTIVRAPLRIAIAASAATMCVTAPVGAIRRLIGLSSLTDAAGIALDSNRALGIAAALGPTAIIGAWVGGGLTHRLPLAWIRFVLILLLAWASVRFLTPAAPLKEAPSSTDAPPHSAPGTDPSTPHATRHEVPSASSRPFGASIRSRRPSSSQAVFPL